MINLFAQHIFASTFHYLNKPIGNQDGRQPVKINDFHMTFGSNLQNRKCRIGYVAYGAYWQRTDNCFYNILQRHMTANHFGDNFGGQIGKNIGLYATAQTIGKYYHCLIGIAHDFYRITAGYLSVFDQLGFANFTN